MPVKRPPGPTRPTFTDQEALQFHSSGRPGKLEVVATKPMATQRDLSLAYSPGVAVPVLAIAEDPSRAYDYTVKGNFVAVITNGTAILGLGNRGALGGKAGDGRQGGAVQALRRHRLHRSRSLHRRPGRVHQLRALSRRRLGRHQSRRHQGAGVLHHRTAPARAARHSRLPRRPARHRHHFRGRLDQRARPDRARHQEHQARVQRRRCCRHRLPRTAQVARLPAGEPDPLRHQGRDLSGPHRRHEPVEVGLRSQDLGAHLGRGAERRRRVLRALGQGRGDARHGQVDGGEADHLRHGQSRSGNHRRGSGGSARRRHHGDRPLRLPQPDQQRARLPLHLPRRARRARLRHQHGDEDRGRACARRTRARGRARRGGGGLRRAAEIRTRLHHPGAVRPAADLPCPAGGGEGRHGYRRRAQADRRHGRLSPAALGAARSDRRRAGAGVHAAAPQPQARGVRRGRGAAGDPRRGELRAAGAGHRVAGRARGPRARRRQRSRHRTQRGHGDHQRGDVDAQRRLYELSSTSGCSGAAIWCATCSG